MDPNIRPSKLVVPRRQSDVLSRKRLLDLLDHMVDQKLVILVAQAGYGKTTRVPAPHARLRYEF